MRRNMIWEKILLMLRGFFMGTADLIPGISGGTVALITGIYDKLVHSISEINFTFIIDFLKRDTRSMKKNFFRINFGFFIPLGTGIIAAFLVLSRVIEHLLADYTAMTYAFFFGLILASSYFVFRKIGESTKTTVVAAAVGFIFAFIFLGLGITDSLGHTYPVIFFSGMVAVCAMILPGISGAFILLFFGQYKYMLGVLNNFQLVRIIIFILGGLSGLMIFSRLLDYLLKKYHSTTLSFLTGLMLGSLRLPIDTIHGVIETNHYSIAMILLTGIIGATLVIILEGFFKRD